MTSYLFVSSKMSDVAILKALGGDVGRSRISQSLTQAELAKESGVSLATVARLERGAGITLLNLVRILRVLGLIEQLGMALLPSPESPLAQLERLKTKPPQQRVRHAAKTESAKWAWGDEDKE